MATYIPLTDLPMQFVDSDGPISGGSLEFYLAGTSTATELFSDNSGTSIGTSISLNSLGYPQSGQNLIHLFRDASKALKVVCKLASGATSWTADNIPAVAYLDADTSTKLDGIEAGADVTDETNVAAAGALMADGSASMSGDLTFGAGTYVTWSVANGLTASATQTQAGGLTLVNGVNEISTCATTGDAVTLPTAVTGRQVIVINNGANTLQIFPAADDSINDLAVDASTTAASGDNIIFVAISDVKWEAV